MIMSKCQNEPVRRRAFCCTTPESREPSAFSRRPSAAADEPLAAARSVERRACDPPDSSQRDAHLMERSSAATEDPACRLHSEYINSFAYHYYFRF